MNRKPMTSAVSAFYADLEFAYRDQIVAGLRGSGKTYRDIARTLGLTSRQVETVLGEVAALRGRGVSQSEIGRRVGLPRTTVQDLLRDKKSGRWTPRKTQALLGLSQMHGMQLDVLGWFLGMERNHVHSLVKQLHGEGLIYEPDAVQAGEKWVVPTRVTAARYLGWRPADWRPPIALAEHYRAVAQARVMYVGAAPELWVSERELRHRLGAVGTGNRRSAKAVEVSTGRAPRLGRDHVHDGRFLGVVKGRHGWWAVEVELSRKDPEYMDIALRGAVRAARDSTDEPMVGVLYLCRSAAVLDNVNAAYQRLPEAEFGELALVLVIRDFDREWKKFLTRYAQLREARKEQSANRRRHRRNLTRLSQQEAS
ncbi:hypothetical protein [Nocardia arthritidis]|uniref:Helix-turn-helix domain-containing protein n=1 Tax=Nocardia arthritidis TaxID=228602 RepID=A0A6G9YKD7_9NOCA|nr:hypothetical protein [Nocardia arthritidis]QIS13651.1 hypothetical protein F5544_29030 [Nocardia arthritidis]